MVAPDRTPLSGDVEVDETTIPYRTKDEPVAGGQGRSQIGKIAVIGAVELLEGNKPGRIRLEMVISISVATALATYADIMAAA